MVEDLLEGRLLTKLMVVLLAVFLDPFEGDGAGSFDGET